MDFTLYWFMFPVSICVATIAMMSGIGGAALFTPLFLIVFPLLGPNYVLESTVAAIAAALFTQTFGFTSGFLGYLRRRLIDYRGALPFIAVGVPVAVAGAILAQFTDPALLKGVYGLLIFLLSVEMVRRRGAAEGPRHDPEPDGDGRPLRKITDRDGTTYTFRAPRQGKGAVATGIGAFLTGMVSVGIGEAVMPQLVKRNLIPIPVAAATSVFIVVTTVVLAASTQVFALVAKGGASAIPWHLVVYSVPGVLIGGQIGPHLQGKVKQRDMEIAIGILFAVIGLAMLYVVYQENA